METRDGEEALERARGLPGPPVAAVSDLQVPHTGGCELAWQLRDDHRELAVVSTWGLPGGASGDSSGLPEGTRMLSRPFSEDTLLEALRLALRRVPGA